MNNLIKLFVTLIGLGSVLLLGPSQVRAQSAHEFSFINSLTDEEIKLSAYKGKVLLVVNTATRCGFASQYKDLQQLMDELNPKGFEVLAVSSNDFNGEPRSGKALNSYCSDRYGVKYPVTNPVGVSSTYANDKPHPFYKWAKESGKIQISKNFEKILIDRDGKIVRKFSRETSPLSSNVREAISKEL
jgi:glutathione peroxidase